MHARFDEVILAIKGETSKPEHEEERKFWEEMRSTELDDATPKAAVLALEDAEAPAVQPEAPAVQTEPEDAEAPAMQAEAEDAEAPAVQAVIR